MYFDKRRYFLVTRLIHFLSENSWWLAVISLTLKHAIVKIEKQKTMKRLWSFVIVQCKLSIFLNAIRRHRDVRILRYLFSCQSEG